MAGTAGLFALTAWAVLNVWGRPPAPSPPEPAPLPIVTVLSVQEEQIARQVERYVRLQPVRTWRLSLEVSGRLAERPVENGARVAQGDPLVRLDPEPFEAERERAVAACKEAQAQRALSGSNLERVRRLFSTGATSKEELDQALANGDRAEAALAASQANERKAVWQHVNCQLAAPAAGIVSELAAEVGQYVAAGQAIGILSQVDTLLVKVLVPWDVRRGVEPGLAATVIDARERAHPAQLLRAAPVQSGQSGQFELEFSVPNAQGQLLAGEPARCRFAAGAGVPRIRLPRTAVFEQYGQWRALVPGPAPPVHRAPAPAEGAEPPLEAHSVPVVLGDHDPIEGWVEIHRGIKPGDQVLIPQRVAAVREGQLVRPGPVQQAWLPPYARALAGADARRMIKP